MKQASFLGNRRGDASREGFRVVHRVGGEPLHDEFVGATRDEIDEACALAAQAFPAYRDLGGARRGEFLRAIAAELEARRDAIVARAMAETGLPEGRFIGELGRTCGQLRMFAGIAEDGGWADVRIDLAQPDRKPPAPDTRSMLRALGPVAIFGASNFPLAFSVAGGDSASALAAGCPIVVKAHPAHPGVSMLAAEAIVAAARSTGMPEGVFSLLFDEGRAVGEALVAHPIIQAVGFTGSQGGGLALWRLAQARPQPIPVYAEMGSVNPGVVFPSKLDDPAFAEALCASATMGVGQFCTNPGLVIALGSAAAFLERYAGLMAASTGGAMLTAGIETSYAAGLERLAQASGVKTWTRGVGPGGAAVFSVSAIDFLASPAPQEEVFGPSTLVVVCETRASALDVIGRLEGQLTAALYGSAEEIAGAADLVAALEPKAGRLIVNQFPTGVEVNASMVHGGPFPATTDPRTTSVGGRAILRWARPVCYQNFPPELLPAELRASE